jgi:hypothetical protein
VILLPSGAIDWPGERLRSVLIHELAHVKRIDSFTRLFARIVCSLFWFIPAVWIAYRQLYTEQEKSCDEYAVGEGIEAVRYVRHILNVVRFVKVRALLTGIFISRGKKKMLEKRILHLLRPRALKFLLKKKMFVAIASLCFLLLFPILVFNPMFAEDTAYILKNSEELYGTWVNAKYNDRAIWAIQNFKPNGTFEHYDNDSAANPPYIGHYLVNDKWTDLKGNIWYTFYQSGGEKGSITGPEGYWLSKISNNGNILEMLFSSNEYPEELDPESLKHLYVIYYRQ